MEGLSGLFLSSPTISSQMEMQMVNDGRNDDEECATLVDRVILLNSKFRKEV